ncbi:MAG: hypothetical protein A2589_02775 [Candidatus Vogelbacteria bacterium RIFOXYD1_FULL_46_19]|uniref:Uncharacterized protein n=1 Tax=Candidatus Vogelbacteria bacterium RIFOXYD1_FULL_46_19 TaxID=1802439 RepID=A0A1G2QH22_9BACT|nr:MAG: hypothetical protein A2589_02775 [Candidatus Vogelbacteria bacterium RIFOXYD1_FULL_46_19]
MDIFSGVLLAGLGGGVVRGLVGYFKYHYSYRNVTFNPLYFISGVVLSGLVGSLAAWVTEDLGITFLGLETLTPALGFIIGYAGGDFIENLFKIITGKTSIYLPAGK